MLSSTIFSMESQMKELEVYKTKYESLGKEINETFESNKRYMEDTKAKLAHYMSKTDEELVKMADR